MVLLVSIYIRLLSTHSETGEYHKAQTSHSEISQITTTTLRRPKCSIINPFIFIFPCPLHAIAFKVRYTIIYILSLTELQKQLLVPKMLWVGRHEKNKMVEIILILGRAFGFTIGSKADRKINKVPPKGPNRGQNDSNLHIHQVDWSIHPDDMTQWNVKC